MTPFGGTPVARNILVDPGIQFKAVEGDALASDGHFHEVRPNLLIEAVAVHSEVARNIPKADQAREDWERFALRFHRPR